MLLARPVHHGLQVGRELRVELHLSPSYRMPEAKVGGMKKLAWDAAGQFARPAASIPGNSALPPRTIHRVTDHGMADVLQVDTDLVRAASLELRVQQVRRGPAFQPTEMGYGSAPLFHHGHPFPLGSVAADGRVDGQRVRIEMSPGERLILAPNLAPLQLLGEVPVRVVGLGDEEEPGGVAI